MTTSVSLAAIDLGAGSGRVQRFDFDGEILSAVDQRRFDNPATVSGGALRWNTSALWEDIADAILGLDAATVAGFASVGADTWGLDSVLLRADGSLVEEPICYRDPRQLRGRARAFAAVGARRIHDETGAHLLAGNAVFGWSDMASAPGAFDDIDAVLMIADHLHSRLSGARVAEASIASTSGAIDMRTGDWSRGLLEDLGIPLRILPELVPAGTDLGPVTGIAGIRPSTRVIAPASHDTASAVLGTPDMDNRSVFISSGTWSLVGMNRPEAVISDVTFAESLTNETTARGTVRLLQNVMGLWLLQECRREWRAEGRDLDYSEMVEAARAVPPLSCVIDANDPSLLSKGDMLSRIRALAGASGGVVPQTVGEVVRCVLDSLAVSYRLAIDGLRQATGVAPKVIRVSGGGTLNALLQQATADATGLPVVAGPIEATALGNAAMQLRGLGEISSDDEIAQVIARSVSTVVYDPQTDARWDAAAAAVSRNRLSSRSQAAVA